MIKIDLIFKDLHEYLKKTLIKKKTGEVYIWTNELRSKTQFLITVNIARLKGLLKERILLV